jgi:hypothetical protein
VPTMSTEKFPRVAELTTFTVPSSWIYSQHDALPQSLANFVTLRA